MRTNIEERECVCQACGDVYNSDREVVDNVENIPEECEEYGTEVFICGFCAHEGYTMKGRHYSLGEILNDNEKNTN